MTKESNTLLLIRSSIICAALFIVQAVCTEGMIVSIPAIACFLLFQIVIIVLLTYQKNLDWIIHTKFLNILNLIGAFILILMGFLSLFYVVGIDFFQTQYLIDYKEPLNTILITLILSMSNGYYFLYQRKRILRRDESCRWKFCLFSSIGIFAITILLVFIGSLLANYLSFGKLEFVHILICFIFVAYGFHNLFSLTTASRIVE